MKFCSTCGASVSLRIPDGDNRERYICNSCNEIHYQNPKIVAGCIPEWEGKILLCRRAIEPRHGLWTLPAGFMENGESTEQAAMRETWEEACARVKLSVSTAFSASLTSARSICCFAVIFVRATTNQGQKAWNVTCLTPRLSPGTDSPSRW